VTMNDITITGGRDSRRESNLSCHSRRIPDSRVASASRRECESVQPECLLCLPFTDPETEARRQVDTAQVGELLPPALTLSPASPLCCLPTVIPCLRLHFHLTLHKPRRTIRMPIRCISLAFSPFHYLVSWLSGRYINGK
jgi:hypothetical protein